MLSIFMHSLQVSSLDIPPPLRRQEVLVAWAGRFAGARELIGGIAETVVERASTGGGVGGRSAPSTLLVQEGTRAQGRALRL